MDFSVLWDTVKHLHNVTGYSGKLRNRVKDGKTVEEEVFRVYVSRKPALMELAVSQRVPPEVEGIPTDIWDIGAMVIPPLMGLNPLAYTQRERPLVAGIGLGNESITVGTFGWYFEKKGEFGLGSNAHVLSEDPLQSGSMEKDILQPGTYDHGTAPEDIVAKYRFHQQLYGAESTCPVSRGLAFTVNSLSMLALRRTRFRSYTEGINKIDFGMTKEPLVDYELEIYGAKEWSGFTSLGFAGSDKASFFCKAQNILDMTGWKPVDAEIEVVEEGDTQHKVGRTSEYTQGKVLDDCAQGTVDYGGYRYIELSDLIMTDAMLLGGDSGSSAWARMVV